MIESTMEEFALHMNETNNVLDVTFNGEEVIVNHSAEYHDMIKRIKERTNLDIPKLNKVLQRGLEKMFKITSFDKNEHGYCIYFSRSKFILSFSWYKNSYYIHTILPWEFGGRTSNCKQLFVNEQNLDFVFESFGGNMDFDEFNIKPILEEDGKMELILKRSCSKCLEVEL